MSQRVSKNTCTSKRFPDDKKKPCGCVMLVLNGAEVCPHCDCLPMTGGKYVRWNPSDIQGTYYD